VRVSVVIPTRDRRESLERVLDALRHEGCHEVIVVDDGSVDDTPRWLAALGEGWPELSAVSTTGVGPNPARAAGAERATGDVVLFLDDDVVPAAGVVAGHARHHRAREGIVVSGYYPVPRSRRMPAATRYLSCSYESDVKAVVEDPSYGLLRLWGGFCSIRRDDLRRVPVAVPAFDGRWRNGDREFGIRCHKGGLRLVFDRNLVATHRYARTLSQLRDDARRSGHGSLRVSMLHPDVAGAGASQRRAVTTFLRTTDRRPVYRVATVALAGLVRIGDAVRLNRIADHAVAALVLVEKRRGARTAGGREPEQPRGSARVVGGSTEPNL